tara:strand:- start:15892 stop:16386 length:495 start_codon:yes stop_codon:yes gene_type:complete
MDFPDLTEYIGPIVFGLIAWLSNYFGKKKKPSEEKGIVEEKKEDTFTSEFNDLYKKIVSPQNNETEKIESEIIPDVVEDDNINIIKTPLVEDVLPEQQITKIKEKDEEKDEQLQEKIEDDTEIIESDNIKLEEKPVDKIRDKIKSKTGLKEAFILKEILDRKYD